MEKFVVEAWDSVDHHWYHLCGFSNAQCVSPKNEAFCYLAKMKLDCVFKNKEMRIVQEIEVYKPNL